MLLLVSKVKMSNNLKQLIPDSLKDTMIFESTDKIRIKVCILTWTGPHHVETKWHTVKTFSKNISQDEIEQSFKEILNSQRFVKLCTSCKQYYVNGHMIDGKLCHSCAEQAGYVF